MKGSGSCLLSLNSFSPQLPIPFLCPAPSASSEGKERRQVERREQGRKLHGTGWGESDVSGAEGQVERTVGVGLGQTPAGRI